jgi:hypothetical protein
MTDRYALTWRYATLNWPPSDYRIDCSVAALGAEPVAHFASRGSAIVPLISSCAAEIAAAPNLRTSGPDCVVIAGGGARTRHEPGIVRVANRRKSARHRVAAQRFAPDE